MRVQVCRIRSSNYTISDCPCLRAPINLSAEVTETYMVHVRDLQRRVSSLGAQTRATAMLSIAAASPACSCRHAQLHRATRRSVSAMGTGSERDAGVQQGCRGCGWRAGWFCLGAGLGGPSRDKEGRPSTKGVHVPRFPIDITPHKLLLAR